MEEAEVLKGITKVSEFQQLLSAFLFNLPDRDLFALSRTADNTSLLLLCAQVYAARRAAMLKISDAGEDAKGHKRKKQQQ